MDKKEVTISIPQWVIKTLKKSTPWAILFTLVVYFASVKIEQKWDKRYDSAIQHQYKYVKEIVVTVPSFLGNSYSFNPFKQKILGIFEYNKLVTLGGIFASLEEEQSKMPVYIKIAIVFSVLLSWKGLRFFILSLICAFGCVWFYNNYHISFNVIPESKEEDPSETTDQEMPLE